MLDEPAHCQCGVINRDRTKWSHAIYVDLGQQEMGKKA